MLQGVQNKQIKRLMSQNFIVYKFKYQLEKIRRMLRVQVNEYHLKNTIQNYQKQNDYFLIPQKQIKIVQELVDQILFTTFQKSQSFLIILLRKFILEVIHKKLSIPFLEQILQILRQYETQIKQYKNHFFQLQQVMMDEQLKLQKSFNIDDETRLQTSYSDIKNCSLLLNLPNQSKEQIQESLNIISPENQKYAKSLIADIQCFSEDSKHTILNNYEDKYFCSQYLTTSQDQRQYNQSTVFQQIKRKVQNKLKIQPLVSAFNYDFKPVSKISIIDFQEQLKEWKRIKQSILKQPSLQGALAPHQIDQSKLLNKMKQNHYRQKIKSVLVKKRLSARHPVA